MAGWQWVPDGRTHGLACDDGDALVVEAPGHLLGGHEVVELARAVHHRARAARPLQAQVCRPVSQSARASQKPQPQVKCSSACRTGFRRSGFDFRPDEVLTGRLFAWSHACLMQQRQPQPGWHCVPSRTVPVDLAQRLGVRRHPHHTGRRRLDQLGRRPSQSATSIIATVSQSVPPMVTSSPP